MIFLKHTSEHKWAKYLQKENVVYCFPCRFFSRRSDIRTTQFASTSGFKNLKDASIRMPEHSASERHKNLLLLVRSS